MLTVKNVKYLFLSIALVAISYFFYAEVFASAPNAIGTIVNSDSLLLPRMGWELWHVPDAWGHFQWPRVPSVAPDMLWFWCSAGLGIGWRSAWNGFFLFSLVLMTCSLGAVIWRLGTLTLCRAVFVAALSVTAYVMFVSLGAHIRNANDIAGLFEVFIPAYHGSAFMLSLLAAATANAAYGRNGRIPAFIPTACLCVVGTFDDPMFLTTFAIPFFVSTRLLALRHRAENVSVSHAMEQGIGPQVFVFLSCCAGLAGQMFLHRQSLGGMFKHFPLAHFPTIIHDALSSVRASFCLIVFVLSLVPFLKFRASLSRPEMTPGREQIFYHGYIASALSLFIMSVAYVEVSLFRYALPAIWWSIAFIVSAISAGTVRKISTACAFVLPAAIAASCFRGGHSRHGGVAQWHAPLETCISRDHDRMGLKDGLAPYWIARQVEASSDWKLQVMQVSDGDHMFIWGNNPDLYTHGVHNFGMPPEFNYFINGDETGLDDLYRNAGRPSAVLHCPGADVLVFPRAIKVK